MTRGMVYKFIWIIFLILVSVTLIFPTVGEKKMEIVMSSTATVQQKEAVKSRFSGESFSYEEKDNIITVTGRSLTDAVMNEVRIFEGVNEARLLKSWVEDKLMAKKINLGLDLQGGMHLVLQANFDKIRQKYVDDVKTIDNKLAGDKKLKEDEKKQLENDRQYITESIIETVDAEKGEYILREKYKSEITQQALELLRNRVDKFGVAEPSIRPSGNEAIEIQLPGVKDPKAVKKALGSTGSLEYRLVDDAYSARAAQWFKEKKDSGKLPEDWLENNQVILSLSREMSQAISLPDDLEILFYYERDKDTKKIYPEYPMALLKQASVEGNGYITGHGEP